MNQTNSNQLDSEVPTKESWDNQVESIHAIQLAHFETLHVQKTTTGLEPKDVWIDNCYSSDEEIPSTCVKNVLLIIIPRGIVIILKTTLLH